MRGTASNHACLQLHEQRDRRELELRHIRTEAQLCPELRRLVSHNENVDSNMAHTWPKLFVPAAITRRWPVMQSMCVVPTATLDKNGRSGISAALKSSASTAFCCAVQIPHR
mgnify:CR=1 FL=1